MQCPPMDPNPVLAVHWFGKEYHLTWSEKRKNKRPHIRLHRGHIKGCRRKHHFIDGSVATRKQVEG